MSDLPLWRRTRISTTYSKLDDPTIQTKNRGEGIQCRMCHGWSVNFFRRAVGVHTGACSLHERTYVTRVAEYTDPDDRKEIAIVG